MIPAYGKWYVNTFSRTLGNVFHIALVMHGMDPEEFSRQFADSDAAHGVESAHPLYLAGMSPREMFRHVTNTTVDCEFLPNNRSPEFWAGYITALAQWKFNCSFSELFASAPFGFILSLYEPYHEMNESKTLDVLEEMVRPVNPLKTKRLARGISQSELSKMTGVNLRSIIAYEQGEIDLENASGATLYRLSLTLECTIEELILGR